MAYAALLSLTQTLELILGSRHEETLEQILGSRHEKRQIKSLHEKLSFLLSFLEDSSHKNTETITCLEGRIRDATYEAEDIIDLHMSKHIDSESASQGVISRLWKFILPNCCFKEKYIGKMKDMNDTEGSSKPSSSNKSTVVGSDDELMQKIKDIKKVLKDIDSILVEVEKMKDMNDTEGSSKSSSSYKSAVEGSDDELMQIKDPLSGLPSKFKSTSIFGKEGIEEEVKTNDLNDVQDLQPRKSLGSTSSKSASTKKNAMVGFEDDLLQIKEQLFGQSQKLKYISIVGMGGIGKTTLARNIYSDLYIEHHFDIRAWTTLSQKYHVRELVAELLNPMVEFDYQLNLKGTEELKTKLYQTLKGKRYLIVMDDVWDANAVDEFRRIFPDDNTGSRIILTTRLSNVAVYADSSSPIHHLSFLNPKQSWNLLCQKVFGKKCCPPELQEIGKRIAEKCKGLPLALVVIGGLLYKAEKTIAQWEYVAENVKSAVTGNYDDFMEIMSWSYKHLPHHLRACFLYMAVFPEDYVIRVSRLIWLWVAEGFLKPVTTKSLEEVAKEYLKELIDRNLIMVRDRIYTAGEIKTCSIHDLMRELCMRKAQDEKFLYVVANQEVEISPEVMKNQRRLSIHKDMRHDKYDSTFHSLLYFTYSIFSYDDRSFQMLRVLEAGTICFYEFPTEIVKLVNLRYIALSYNRKFKIPASISNICNLQTLIVFGKSWPKELFLPEELLKMPGLRHLLFDEGVLLCSHGPQNTNLQTLCGVKDFRFTEEAIQIIQNLKTLGTCYNSETELSFYCLENLVHLRQLESFKCVLSEFWRIPLPQNLAFPPNLKKLTLRGSFIISLDNMSVVGSLPNLEVLKLKRVKFQSNAWKTNEGEFSRLKFLLVEGKFLKIWEADEEVFPSLECLCLRRCKQLDRIPSGIGEIPTLQLIILEKCSSSAVTSANKILEEQQDLGNDYLEVHSY